MQSKGVKYKPSNWAQVVKELHQRTNCSKEPEFDSWVEQFLVTLYLPHSRTLDYRGPLPLATGGLTLATTEEGEKYTSNFHQVLSWKNIDSLYELHVSIELSVIFLQVTFPYVLQNLLLIDIKLSDTCIRY
jgi:hypothetical protein